MKTAIYVRVSTKGKGQDINMQLVPLREYCERAKYTVIGEFIDDGVSGTKNKRPALNEVMELARKRKIDCVIVWRLDRWGRSMEHLVTSVKELHDLGIKFVSFMENIDFGTPTGKLMFHMLSALAEFYRNLLVENVKEGLENAKRKGKKLGRKPVAPVDRGKVIALHLGDPKLSVRSLVKKTGMSIGGVHKTLSLFKAGKIDNSGFEVSQ